MSSVAKIIPTLNTLIKDVEARGGLLGLVKHVKTMKDVQPLLDDLRAIFGGINTVYDFCKIQKPTFSGSMNEWPNPHRVCAGAAAITAGAAADVIKNANSSSKIITFVSVFAGKQLMVLDACGIRI